MPITRSSPNNSPKQTQNDPGKFSSRHYGRPVAQGYFTTAPWPGIIREVACEPPIASAGGNRWNENGQGLHDGFQLTPRRFSKAFEDVVSMLIPKTEHGQPCPPRFLNMVHTAGDRYGVSSARYTPHLITPFWNSSVASSSCYIHTTSYRNQSDTQAERPLRIDYTGRTTLSYFCIICTASPGLYAASIRHKGAVHEVFYGGIRACQNKMLNSGASMRASRRCLVT